MSINRRHVLRAGLIAAVIPATAAACSSTDTSNRYETGFVEGSGVSTEIEEDDRSKALDFSAKTYDGETFTLSAKNGSPVVLNVWYASCAPCRKEAPDLKAIYDEYAIQGVAFIGVNVRDEAGPAKAFEEKFSVPYPSIPDLEGTVLYELRGQVAPNAVPATLVFDKKGRVAARISGIADPSILRAMIDRVMGE